MKIVIYHGNCMDGFTAAWVARKALGDEVEFVAANHGSPQDSLKRLKVAGNEIYILDFSYDRDTLIQMHEEAASLVVLDHHASAQLQLEGLGYCVFDMKRSGAGMTWDYFFPDQPRPWVIDYVEDRDLWNWALPDSREINDYIRLQEKTFEAWDLLMSLPIQEARALGEVARKVVDQYVEEMGPLAQTVTLDGFPELVGYAINAPYWRVSDLLNALTNKPIPSGPHKGRWPDFSLGWFENRSQKLRASLRSADYPDGREACDVSKIATHFGGGGHRRASGLNCEAPIWSVVEAKE